MVELRRHQRAPIDVPVEFVAKGASGSGRSADISLGGMFVQTAAPPPFGTELVIHLTLPGQKAPFALTAVVRWTRAGEGMGVQFSPMGARETHAITELTRVP